MIEYYHALYSLLTKCFPTPTSVYPGRSLSFFSTMDGSRSKMGSQKLSTFLWAEYSWTGWVAVMCALHKSCPVSVFGPCPSLHQNYRQIGKTFVGSSVWSSEALWKEKVIISTIPEAVRITHCWNIPDLVDGSWLTCQQTLAALYSPVEAPEYYSLYLLHKLSRNFAVSQLFTRGPLWQSPRCELFSCPFYVNRGTRDSLYCTWRALALRTVRRRVLKPPLGLMRTVTMEAAGRVLTAIRNSLDWGDCCILIAFQDSAKKYSTITFIPFSTWIRFQCSNYSMRLPWCHWKSRNLVKIMFIFLIFDWDELDRIISWLKNTQTP